jgi:hypothetical protein
LTRATHISPTKQPLLRTNPRCCSRQTPESGSIRLQQLTNNRKTSKGETKCQINKIVTHNRTIHRSPIRRIHLITLTISAVPAEPAGETERAGPARTAQESAVGTRETRSRAQKAALGRCDGEIRTVRLTKNRPDQLRSDFSFKAAGANTPDAKATRTSHRLITV